ncbi:MAG: HAD hydrolase-like protein [Bacteroidales bacterium]
MNNSDTIIWDWNGTLLNDVDICLESINELLDSRNLKPLNKEEYRHIFTFPVRDYYVKAGFDFSKEPFDEVAVEFIDLYHEKLAGTGLFEEVIDVLEFFKQREFKQVMVSAMEHNSLLTSVAHLGIEKYFENINGIDDHFAESKITLARKIINDNFQNGSNITLIGDTLHDAEVAGDLGIDCILVARGHQSHERLLKSGCSVVKDLSEIIEMFK